MKKIRIWTLIGLSFTAIAGTLLHFTYEWFGGRIWAVLGAVSESTWEHLKLLFWPMLFMTLAEYIFYGRKIAGFLVIRLISILTGMAAVVMIFYTYSGILGYNFLAADIATFLAGAAAAYGAGYVLLRKSEDSGSLRIFGGDAAFVSVCGLAALIAIALLFVIFTYGPPHLALFEDPLTGHYGLDK